MLYVWGAKWSRGGAVSVQAGRCFVCLRARLPKGGRSRDQFDTEVDRLVASTSVAERSMQRTYACHSASADKKTRSESDVEAFLLYCQRWDRQAVGEH